MSKEEGPLSSRVWKGSSGMVSEVAPEYPARKPPTTALLSSSDFAKL
jgi:hypothetical protein